MYTCMDTGNVHVCTRGLCEFMTSSDNELACSLTGLSQGVAFDHAKTRDAPSFAQGGGAHMAERTSIGDSVLDIHCYRRIGRVVKNTKRTRKRKISTELPLIESTVDTVLAHAMPFLRPHRQSIVDACHSMWLHTVLPSASYKSKPGSYTIPYHCVVVLYYMCNGGLSFLPNNAYGIISAIPGVDAYTARSSTRKLTEIRIDPGRKQFFASATYTRTEKIFLKCVNEIMDLLLKGEEQLAGYVRIMMDPAIGCNCKVLKQSETSLRDFVAKHGKAKCVANKVDMATFRHLLSAMKNRTKVRYVHISCSLTENDPSNTPLFNVWIS
jgi:hypothetical protein